MENETVIEKPKMLTMEEKKKKKRGKKKVQTNIPPVPPDKTTINLVKDKTPFNDFTESNVIYRVVKGTAELSIFRTSL